MAVVKTEKFAREVWMWCDFIRLNGQEHKVTLSAEFAHWSTFHFSNSNQNQTKSKLNWSISKQSAYKYLSSSTI